MTCFWISVARKILLVATVAGTVGGQATTGEYRAIQGRNGVLVCPGMVVQEPADESDEIFWFKTDGRTPSYENIIANLKPLQNLLTISEPYKSRNFTLSESGNTLHIPMIELEDEGSYTCWNAGTASGIVDFNMTVSVQPQALTTQVPVMHAGELVTVSCVVPYIRPLPRDVRWLWMNQSLQGDLVTSLMDSTYGVYQLRSELTFVVDRDMDNEPLMCMVVMDTGETLTETVRVHVLPSSSNYFEPITIASMATVAVLLVIAGILSVWIFVMRKKFRDEKKHGLRPVLPFVIPTTDNDLYEGASTIFQLNHAQYYNSEDFNDGVEGHDGGDFDQMSLQGRTTGNNVAMETFPNSNLLPLESTSRGAIEVRNGRYIGRYLESTNSDRGFQTIRGQIQPDTRNIIHAYAVDNTQNVLNDENNDNDLHSIPTLPPDSSNIRNETNPNISYHVLSMDRSCDYYNNEAAVSGASCKNISPQDPLNDEDYYNSPNCENVAYCTHINTDITDNDGPLHHRSHIVAVNNGNGHKSENAFEACTDDDSYYDGSLSDGSYYNGSVSETDLESAEDSDAHNFGSDKLCNNGLHGYPSNRNCNHGSPTGMVVGRRLSLQEQQYYNSDAAEDHTSCDHGDPNYYSQVRHEPGRALVPLSLDSRLGCVGNEEVFHDSKENDIATGHDFDESAHYSEIVEKVQGDIVDTDAQDDDSGYSTINDQGSARSLNTLNEEVKPCYYEEQTGYLVPEVSGEKPYSEPFDIPNTDNVLNVRRPIHSHYSERDGLFSNYATIPDGGMYSDTATEGKLYEDIDIHPPEVVNTSNGTPFYFEPVPEVEYFGHDSVC